jgi:hypothetical protein
MDIMEAIDINGDGEITRSVTVMQIRIRFGILTLVWPH